MYEKPENTIRSAWFSAKQKKVLLDNNRNTSFYRLTGGAVVEVTEVMGTKQTSLFDDAVRLGETDVETGWVSVADGTIGEFIYWRS